MRLMMRLLSYTLSYAVDILAKFSSYSIGSTNQLLLIRLDAIGDFVIWLDSAKEFRSLYPNVRIVLCVNSVCSQFAKILPYWDEVIEVDIKRFDKNFVYRYRLLRQIRRCGFETAIQPTFSRVFLHGDALVRATGAKHRIGSAGDLTNMHPLLKRISDGWYTKLIPAAAGSTLELERNAEFIENLSGRAFKAGLPVLPSVYALPTQLQVNAAYFVVFPGASWTGRQWPVSKFAETAVILHRKTGWIPVLCGGPGDGLVCQDAIDQIGLECAINLSGLTTLIELTQLLREAKLLISNETSAVHIAVSVSTPNVCILGGGHYGRFMPYAAGLNDGRSVVADHKMPCYNCNWLCTQPHIAGGSVPCIASVTVEKVLEQVRVVLFHVENQGAIHGENQIK
jgi:ADP-heptose:LPS heptosyltransferase